MIDGTTTATVLAASIMKEGLKLVAAGMNPMDLKRGIDIAVTAVVKDIERRAKKVQSSEEIAQIGTIASNGDKSVGKMIADAMKKVGNEGVITVEEAKTAETELDVVEGMQFDRGYLSPYFITNAEKMIAELDDAYILIHEKKLSSLQPMLPVLRRSFKAASRWSSSPRTSRAKRSPPWSSTSCAAASRSRLSSPPALAIAARRCLKISPSSRAAR